MSIEEVSNMANAEFWGRYLKRGDVGLVGGTTWIHKAIRDAEALITPDKKPSMWAHAFICSGKKPDGHVWIAESSISIKPQKMQIVNGAQENRIDEYYGTEYALNCAVLSFGLKDTETDKIIGKALDMVARKIMYPVSGLIGTLFAYLFKTERWRNLWNTKNALYCSAFVQEAYLEAGIDLAPDVATANTSPEHLWQTQVPHKAYLLKKR